MRIGRSGGVLRPRNSGARSSSRQASLMRVLPGRRRFGAEGSHGTVLGVQLGEGVPGGLVVFGGEAWTSSAV